MFAAMAEGESRVFDPLRGDDCEATLRCMNQLGLRHEWISESEARLIPTEEWTEPLSNLDCGNSGTTMRLLSGLVASRNLDVTMVGDASLSRRPMKRIADPLRLMGASIEGDTPPLRIRGSSSLTGIEYQSPVASAQIKSAVLLAGLRATGRTTVIEPSLSRDHTERMLTALGVVLERVEGFEGKARVSLEGGARIQPFEFRVPGDISSAAFFMVAALILPGACLEVQHLGVNPSRDGILDVFSMVGGLVGREDMSSELGEPVASLRIERGPEALKPFEIQGSLVPRLIDEIPVLGVLATQCEGTSVIRDAKELRVKECDRLEVMAAGLRAMGASVETFEDGLAITGPTPLKGTVIEAQHDHRIAMAFAIAGLIAEGRTDIDGAESVATSYPEFEQELRRLCIV